MSHHKILHVLPIVVAAALLVLAGCGSGSRSMNSGNFSGIIAAQSELATGTNGSRPGVATVRLSPAQLTGGASMEMTVELNQPAPADGITVQLKSSDASVVTIPATVKIPFGATSSTVDASTAPVRANETVAITAFYGDTVGGTSLSIAPTTTSLFSIAIQPSTITIAPGHSGLAKVITKVTTGYDHALRLTASNLPAGVSVTFAPSLIPAPGAGTSKATISVSSSVTQGTYFLRVTASDGQTSHSSRLTLTVATHDPGAKFRGCWQKQNGHRYQGVDISVANPGTYPFDAVLYRGATCDPNQSVDEFGFGTPLPFGGFDYIFWFTDFADQSNTSAVWHVGQDRSQCVNYAVAPDC